MAEQHERRASDSLSMSKAMEPHVEHDECAMQLFDETGVIRKIPIPTNDPNDPLIWRFWTRATVFMIICIYGITGFGVVQSTPLFFNEIIGDYMAETRGTFNVAKIGYLASYPSLCMGLGNFLFVPLSLMLGRRPVAIICSCLMVASCAWAAYSNSFNSHLGARCVQGLAAGIADCLLPLIILDITFVHQRGRWMTLYWSVTAIGSSLFLITVPFLVHSYSDNWRVNYYFWLGFACLTCFLVIFCLPETMFYRLPALLNGRLVTSDAYGQIQLGDAFEVPISHVETEEVQVAQSKRTLLRRLSPFCYQPPKGLLETFLGAYQDMLVCLTNPAIIWTLVLNSILFAGLVILSMTYERSLQGPPWLFKPQLVGTAHIGAVIGSVCAYLFTGTMIERIVEALVSRNKGVREPEHLLPNFALPAVLGATGLCLYGVVGGNPFKYSWVGIHASFGLYYSAFVAMSALSSMWLAELTPKRAGPAIVLICGGRNAASFGISYSFTPWLAKVGFQNVHITIGCMLLGVALFAIPLFFANKHLRRVWSSFAERKA